VLQVIRIEIVPESSSSSISRPLYRFRFTRFIRMMLVKPAIPTSATSFSILCSSADARKIMGTGFAPGASKDPALGR